MAIIKFAVFHTSRHQQLGQYALGQDFKIFHRKQYPLTLR